jgi:hypothetical protein|eukprot:gene43072-53458_t
MKTTEAVQILEALAKGIDPETGEMLQNDSPLHNPFVIRALFLGAKALEQAPTQPKPARESMPGLESAGQRWTQDEEARLLQGFDTGASLKELAAVHQRKVGGIRSRLIKLGRLEASTADDSAP